jgi:ubiquinone/menaquinone biosynthesis C-methylase UbiE
MDRLFQQWKKPTGLLGNILTRILNISHSKGIQWGLEQIEIKRNDIILDIGCGGGSAVRIMAEKSINGKVYGIDYSPESVQISKANNSKLIYDGRVFINQGNVSKLDFADNYFDLITAINSHYYWPNLLHDLCEVLRTLKPSGKFVIIGESYKGSKFEKRDRAFIDSLHMNYHSTSELVKILSTIGYINITIKENYEKGWICCISQKQVN